MIEFIVWVLQNIALAPYYLFVAITNPGAWLNWSNPEAVMRFIYYGASVEFFFVIFTTFLVITALGMFWSRRVPVGACAGWRRWPTCRAHRRLGGPHDGPDPGDDRLPAAHLPRGRDRARPAGNGLDL
jgi:hypothetical protein